MESQIAQMEDEQNFDREAYDKLKDNLRMRKEAKERILSQGLPEFKAYLRFWIIDVFNLTNEVTI